MADYRAIAAVCESVVQLLEAHYRPQDFNNDLDFEVYTAANFSQPMTAGVSLFLYRVDVSDVRRSVRRRINERENVRLLPLELRFLLTVWGVDASLQHMITAWMMRVLSDYPLLSSAQLNRSRGSVFNENESVEIAWQGLTNEDLSQIWDSMIRRTYQFSVPYLARTLQLESAEVEGGGPIVERRFEYGS